MEKYSAIKLTSYISDSPSVSDNVEVVSTVVTVREFCAHSSVKCGDFTVMQILMNSRAFRCYVYWRQGNMEVNFYSPYLSLDSPKENTIIKEIKNDKYAYLSLELVE